MLLTLIIDFVKLVFVTFVVHVFTTNVSVSKWVFVSILNLLSVSKISVNYGISGRVNSIICFLETEYNDSGVSQMKRQMLVFTCSFC